MMSTVMSSLASLTRHSTVCSSAHLSSLRPGLQGSTEQARSCLLGWLIRSSGDNVESEIKMQGVANRTQKLVSGLRLTGVRELATCGLQVSSYLILHVIIDDINPHDTTAAAAATEILCCCCSIIC